MDTDCLFPFVPDFCSSLRLRPWVGSRYFEQKQRVMFLGLKMYSPDPVSLGPDATSECVEASLYHADDEYDDYFDIFDKMIDLIRCSDESREDAWQRVVFYNFTQVPLPSFHSRPSAKQVAADNPNLIRALLTFRPHKVIAWGKWLYDSVLRGYGCRAQNINGVSSWAFKLSEFDDSAAAHVVHECYVNDPSHADFDFEMWRTSVSEFLTVEPRHFLDPQIKRRMRVLLEALGIPAEGFVAPSGLSLIDVLSKAVGCSVLSLGPESAEFRLQRLRASSVVASAYFASLLRSHLAPCSSAADVPSHTLVKIMNELLDPSAFALSMSDDQSSVVFTRTRGRDSAAIFRKLQRLQKSQAEADGRAISWKALEALFNSANLRQAVKDVAPSRPYVAAIDAFFARYVLKG